MQIPPSSNASIIRKTLIRSLAVVLTMAVCGPALGQRNRDAVVVAPFSSEATESSYLQLEDQLMRFAARFGTRVGLATDQMMDDTEDPAMSLNVLRWKNVSVSTMVQLAVGADTVTNLLDMLVVTTLTRLTLEDYWLPEVLGAAYGQPLLDAYLAIETDIWSIADRVLTEPQQADLRALIEEWHRDNPDQIYPWYIRLDEFSGQRAAALRGIKDTGGLLGIRGAAQSIDELSSLAERMMFYLLHAPLVIQNALRESLVTFAQSPEAVTTLSEIDRFVSASESFADTVATLPNQRFELVTQITEDFSAERQALFENLEALSPQAIEVLDELEGSLLAFERILLLTGADREKDPDDPGFEIQNYRDLATESAAAAREFQNTLNSLESLLNAAVRTDESISNAVDRLESFVSHLILRLTLAFVVIIAFFFVALLGYRLALSHLRDSRPAA